MHRGNGLEEVRQLLRKNVLLHLNPRDSMASIARLSLANSLYIQILSALYEVTDRYPLVSQQDFVVLVFFWEDKAFGNRATLNISLFQLRKGGFLLLVI